GGLFPAFILSIWWKRANAVGTAAGIAAGFVVTAALVGGALYPDALPLLAFAASGGAEFAATTGILVGFAVIVAVSLATAAPSAEQNATVDAIPRPGGTPFV